MTPRSFGHSPPAEFSSDREERTEEHRESRYCRPDHIRVHARGALVGIWLRARLTKGSGV